MNAHPMTRRSLLGASAGALAAGLASPRGVLAALAAPPALEERWLGQLRAGVLSVDLARSADLLGVQWLGDGDARLQLRFRGPGGRWSPWAQAGSAGHGPDDPRTRERSIGEPVWTGGTRAIQLRAAQPLHDVHNVDRAAHVWQVAAQ